MPKLTKTGTRGIYRRHTKGCRGGRCDCSYVVVWRHRGKQETQTCRTFAEAREAKGNRDAGDSRPTSRIILGDYFEEWIETYSGRTSRGLAALPDDDWRLFFEFLAHTGLRISEAVGLRWEHLDLGKRPRVLVREQFYEGKRSRLKSKSGKRDVPLSPGMAERLRAKRPAGYREAAPVFSTSAGTELNRANVASRILKPPAKAARVPWASFHGFRHTCASALRRGAERKQVAEWLGHADPAFTLRTYVHLLDDGVGGAEFFDELALSSQLDSASCVPDKLPV